MTADVQQQVQHDVQDVKSRGTSGERLQSAMQDVTHARDQYKDDPKAYADYMKSLTTGLSDQQNLLPALELADPKMNRDSTLLRDMSKNNDELYKVLDTYTQKQGQGQLDGAGSNADGKVGTMDIEMFVADAEKDPNSVAAKYAKENPGLIDALKQRNDEGFDKSSLLGSLGLDSQEAFDRTQQNAGKPIVMNGPSGRPETIVEPNGTATGIHYDANGNIDGVAVSQNGGTQRSMRNEQGQWVDENGQPAKRQAPFMKDGQMGFYQPVEGSDSKFTKFSVDMNTGKVTPTQVDLNGVDDQGKPIAIQGLNRPEAVDPNNKNPFKVGNLDVTAVPLAEGQQIADGGITAQAQAGYQVKPGENLTDITRRALGKDSNYDGADLQAAMQQLAKANGYENADQIPANSTLVIPPDFNTRPSVEQPQQAAVPGDAQAVAPQGMIGPGAEIPSQANGEEGAPEVPSYAAPEAPGVGPSMIAPTDLPDNAPAEGPSMVAPTDLGPTDNTQPTPTPSDNNQPAPAPAAPPAGEAMPGNPTQVLPGTEQQQ